MSVHASDSTTRRLFVRSDAAGGDDPIFALNAEAARRRAAGEDVVNSTLGVLLDETGALATLSAVGEAYRRIAPERGAPYAPIAGPPAFLEAVKSDLFGSSELRAQAVAVATPGGTGALATAVASFLAPGESLLTSSFYWSPYETIATQAGRRLKTFPMFTAAGRFDVAALACALERLAREQSRALLFLNTPCHNPTGYSLDQADWSELIAVLLERARHQRLTLLLDLAYARFGEGDARAWVPHVERLVGSASVLVAWSASKAFAQYGARVGACVALEADPSERRRVETALAAYCRGVWSNCNHLGILAVSECLVDPTLRARADGERAALRKMLHARVELFARLAARAGLSHPRYAGGFFVTVFCADAVRAAKLLRDAGVFVVPLEGAVRVALCSTPLASIPRLVEALRAAVSEVGR